MHYRNWLLAMALALCTPRRALAQATDAIAQADEHFRQGREALAGGDYKLALRFFRSSHKADPGKGKLLNIALCEEKLGMVTTATRHFQEVLPQLASDDQRVPVVQQHLAELAPRISHLQVNLAATAPSGVIVAFDGAPLTATALGTEMAVDPGTYVIAVNATGRPEKRYDVVLEESKSLVLTVAPAAASPPKPAVSIETPKPETRIDQPKPLIPIVAPQPMSSRRIAGFVVGGAGVAGLAVGGVTGVLSLMAHEAIESQCPTHVGCSSEIISKASSGKFMSIMSVVTLSAGAVGVGAGVFLVLSSRTSTPAPTVGLTLLPDGGRLGIRGSF